LRGPIPDRPSNISVLRSSTLLNSLSGDDLEELAETSHMAYAERGETIWMHGGHVDFFGLVGEGFVKMVKSFDSGQEVTTEIFGPGQIFGLLSTVDGTGCPLAARAVCNTWYLKAPKTQIKSIYDDQMIFREQLMRRTIGRFRQTSDMMAKLAIGRVDERIALILLMLSESYGHEEGKSVTISIPLIRQDIAEMAGTTVESTIRTMSRWQKSGAVISQNGHITICDHAKFEETLR
jgi:CRP/FNR family transcriptional regulator